MRHLVALDIETDTSPLTEDETARGFTSRGLDPAITRVTAAALYGRHRGDRPLVIDHQDERELLSDLFDMIRLLSGSATFVTWNGSCFDFPFLDARARTHRLTPPFRMRLDETVVPKYAPTPGFAGGYEVTVNGTSCVDVAYLVKDECERAGVQWSLKPYAQHLGFDPVVVDRAAMHDLTDAQRREYVASDAKITWQIARQLDT